MPQIPTNAQRTRIDPKRRAKGLAQRRGSCRRVLSASITFALSSVGSSSISAETATHNAVEFALRACAQLPDGKDVILNALEQHGWTKPADFNVLTNLFASTKFAFKHSTENAELLEKSIANAFFMSASVLGNSALPPNQPVFVHEDVSIGVIGLTLSKSGLPYCVIGGPSALFDLFAEKISLTPSKIAAHGFLRNPEGQVHTGQFLNATISATTIDLDSILLKGLEFELDAITYTSDLTLELAIERFHPFNAYILPQRSGEGD